jgi:EAL domain-containing protein (putative c-di-GMP-specific phosphodiesterase class I)
VRTGAQYLSPVQFRRHDIPKTILSALEGVQLDLRFLEIELTDGMLMTDPERSAQVLMLLRARGSASRSTISAPAARA